MEVVRSFGKITIKQIFSDYWVEYLKLHLKVIPTYVVDEVEKMLACRDPLKSGYHLYVCPEHPLERTYVPHSCKSRFCNVCGVVQTNKWMKEATSYFPDCGYFHIVLTLPDTLWYFFNIESKKPLLDLLFKSANESVLNWFKTNRKVLPGAVAVLHTFGKKINYNTHIHMIVSAGGLSREKIRGKSAREKEKSYFKIKRKYGDTFKINDDEYYVWKKVDSLPDKYVFSRMWKATVLKNLNKYVGPLSFYSDFTKKCWYTHNNFVDDAEFTCNYIGRYSKRPPMAETRIVKYENGMITFYYDERDDEYGEVVKRDYITLPWEKFITLLIAHIMPPQFKMVRHYGLFSNRTKNTFLPIVYELLHQKIKKTIEWSSWRVRQTAYLGFDPLICKICGKEMILKEMAFWSKKFDRLYVKHMDLELSFVKKLRDYCALFTVFEYFFTFLSDFLSIFSISRSQIYGY